MSFTHGLFLFYFLPFALIAHRIALSFRVGTQYNVAARLTLFLLTLLFYGFSHPWWILPLLACIGFDFLWASLLCKENRPKARKLYCTLSIIQNLSLLGIFKYWNFLCENIAVIAPNLAKALPQFSADTSNPILPAGISFYTFESLSFVIDVYRRQISPPKKATEFFAFIAMFPRFVAGPIVRYKDMAGQFANYGGMHVEQGLLIFIVGLFYKCCFADSFEVFNAYAFNGGSTPEFLAAWIGALAYTMQIYFDFAGYSLMAIGLGWCLGFRFPENFKLPYLASSLDEFWRRWHISLSSWLRDYLYIPLGGNRGGNWKQYRNLFITMTLGGLWHGASWNYVIWGMWHGLWLGFEKGIRSRWNSPLWAGQIFTFTLVVVGFVFFRSSSISEANVVLTAMFHPSGNLLAINLTGFALHPIALSFSILGILHCFVFEKYFQVLSVMELPEIKWSTRFAATAMLACSILLVLSHNPIPFIYYQF